MKNGFKNSFKKWQWSVLVIVFLVICVLYILQSILTRPFTTIAFLNVGQGDAIFIEAPNGNQVLVDAGRDMSVVRELSTVLPFWDRSIDLIIPTHADGDHVGGFPEVFKRYQVKAVLDTTNTATTSIYEEYTSQRDKEDVPTLYAMSDHTLVLDEGAGVYFRILFPDQDVSNLARNEASTVVQLVHGDIEVVLTGDAGVMIEEYLVRAYGKFLESEILKAGHHGSKTSTSDLFLQTVNPRYVVVSAGEDNRYGHPHPEVVERVQNFGSLLFQTSEGSVIFETNGSEVWVK